MVNSSTRALIVEDLEFWQDALNEILTDAGYQVRTASNYAQALDALARDSFQLAVIDPVLDDADRRNRDGLRVLQHILDEQPDTCTLVVTASNPDRIQGEVGDISTDTPLLYKDKWDDDQFLELVRTLLTARAEHITGGTASPGYVKPE